jgi:hypothetical protein
MAPGMMLGSVPQTLHLREVVELREVVTTSLEEVVAVEETVLVFQSTKYSIHLTSKLERLMS